MLGAEKYSKRLSKASQREIYPPEVEPKWWTSTEARADLGLGFSKLIFHKIRIIIPTSKHYCEEEYIFLKILFI